MKCFYFFILSVLLYSCSYNTKTISIIECQDIYSLSPNVDLHKDKEVVIINSLGPNVDLHKDKDVEIFISDNDENRLIYSCIIYRLDQGELRGYQVHLSSLNTFDKAIYKWLNDSTVTFNLNNAHKKSTKYTVMGYGDSALIGWEN